jgi:hypothetical protein
MLKQAGDVTNALFCFFIPESVYYNGEALPQWEWSYEEYTR